MAMHVADKCDGAIMAQLQTMLQQYNPFVQISSKIVATQDVNLCSMAETGKSTAVVPEVAGISINLAQHYTHHHVLHPD